MGQYSISANQSDATAAENYLIRFIIFTMQCVLLVEISTLQREKHRYLIYQIKLLLSQEEESK